MLRPPAMIVLFAYNRPLHLRHCLQSLRACPEAKESFLTVFADGARHGGDSGVAEVREVLSSIEGFAGVRVVHRERNLGLVRSIEEGLAEIFQREPAAIVVEDDLVVSPAFLSYLNQGLAHYEKHEEVACLSAYVYPASGLPDGFFLKGADCWGWATWQRAWRGYRNDARALLSEVERRGLRRELDIDGSYPYYRLLRRQARGKRSSWAVCWYASCFLANKLCLYPARSLVRNAGIDGSGTSTDTDVRPYEPDSLAAAFPEFESIPLQANAEALRLIAGHHRRYRRDWARRLGARWRHYRERWPGARRRLRRWDLRLRGPVKWRGRYASWAEASEGCSSYAADEIITRTLASARAVRDGLARYERDTVLFDDGGLNTPLLRALSSCAAKTRAPGVIDFGGSLGTHYFQHRRALAELGIPIASWTVVEQPALVEIGRREFQDATLRFQGAEALGGEADLLILSSVLPYLEEPYRTLQEWLRRAIPFVFVDRTGFCAEDRLTRQTVCPPIYRASYPCWFFSEKKFREVFAAAGYQPAFEFEADDVSTIDSRYLGFLFRREK